MQNAIWAGHAHILFGVNEMAEYRKTALVTGGGGFAGGKLCEALHEKGYKVIAVDVHFLEGAREDEGILQEKVIDDVYLYSQHATGNDFTTSFLSRVTSGM